MLLRLRKSVDGWNRHKEVYEWNPGNGTWYRVHRSNMILKGPLRLQGNLFNAVLRGLIATVTGSYNRNARKLTLRL